MKKYKRVFLIVMDSLGIGAEPDAALYGDATTDTFGHIAERYPLNIPNLQNLGISNLHPLKGVQKVGKPLGYYGILQETSKGKDTLTGHWEIMGLNVQQPFIAFTDTGFPQELMDELKEKTGHDWLGNYSASGTEIIKELGEQAIKEGKMIVYTSADSVLQIAAHEKYFGLEELYRCCKIAREITMKPEWRVGRIIARPFIGESSETFTRTSNRHDYAIAPYQPTVLDSLKESGYDVISVGKINDIFSGCGITEAYKSKSNSDGMEITISMTEKDFTGICFTNLVDFDALWGHRRNPEGYGKEIDVFDKYLGQLMEKVNDDDLIILTADHGNDPTWVGTDHTREQVPCICFSKSLKSSGQLPTSKTFANIGYTIADNFEVKLPENGESFLDLLK
ncbi:MAG: phosphopentomutase [Erysipelotrichaceae bacterium]|nr:phosphopentomutase [Erysipelotrichaceae bacterium]MDY3829557.1 phosphopentomutase [Erysipelotrichaceae bacterium]MDY5728556.1 phosphopentomutase [Erysipelotrichaceae bacterium]